MMRQLKATGK